MNKDYLNSPENKKFLLHFEKFLKEHFTNLPCSNFKGHQQLKESIQYSVFSGGKYFRPLLVFATSQLLGIKSSLIIPWAAAIQTLHVASIIHDDLPCMDNSSQRRGKISNHRRFGENLALLAGDCLWIEAFRFISLYATKKQQPIWLSILCETGSFNGLMGGQALDLIPEKAHKSYYTKMHSMKTGALISASIEGVLQIQNSKKINNIKKASHLIGQAFQLADDLQDIEDDSNFAQFLGYKQAKKKLHKLSDLALKLIHSDEPSSCANLLKNLVLFNRDRSDVIINKSNFKTIYSK